MYIHESCLNNPLKHWWLDYAWYLKLGQTGKSLFTFSKVCQERGIKNEGGGGERVKMQKNEVALLPSISEVIP